MNMKRWTHSLALAAMVVMVLANFARASFVDRDYRLGDGDSGPPTNGSVVNVTFDDAGVPGQNQLVDLVSVGAPVYRTITGRPDGVGGLGIEFNGAAQQFLRGSRLGEPSTSFSSIASNTLNYNGITDRGLQFWARPSSASGPQTLVMDTNQHGARINAAGNFSMRYAGNDFDSGVSADANTWYHIMVVRPQGPAGGSRMYIDGIAVAAAPGGYNGGDLSDLVLGSNTGGDDQNFTGGTAEFFTGILDDLEMFVIGQSTSPTDPLNPNFGEPGVDFGSFDFATDNAFAAFTLSGLPGDLDNNGVLDENDRDAFISGWMQENVINGIRVGDLNTLGNGDLNFDGVTDIFDLLLMQNALMSSGIAAITAAELSGAAVPEPATLVGIVLGAAALAGYRRRQRTTSV